MDQRGHDQHRGVVRRQDEGHDAGQPLRDLRAVRSGPQVGQLAGLLTGAARPSHLVRGQQPGRRGRVQARQGLRRGSRHQRPEVLGLRRRLHDPAQHLLQRVGLGRPGGGAAHEVADDVEGHLRPVEGGAGPGAAHP